MEVNTETKTVQDANGLSENSNFFHFEWSENITEIDLSYRKIQQFADNIKMPINIISLKISHNNLSHVPDIILKHGKLKVLDVSYNQIQYFNETPNFLHSIEELDISNNNLCCPPIWVWVSKPKKLHTIDISNNFYLTKSFTDENFGYLLQYKTCLKNVIIHNCNLSKFKELLGTFPQASHLQIGIEEVNYCFINKIETMPCAGLEECCDIETINLSNTHIHMINANINIYKNMKHLNLSINNISGIPNEFYELIELETCILSNNKIMYISKDIEKLKKLKNLYLNNNEICMVPEELASLPNLELLDLYNNKLYEIPETLYNLPAIDVGQNFFDEPVNQEYIEKKVALSMCDNELRIQGRKYEFSPPASEHSPTTSDDEFYENLCSHSGDEECSRPRLLSDASEEDWDSDDYWMPLELKPQLTPRLPTFHQQRYLSSNESWLHFVKQKIKDGNFCPIDLHTVPVIDQVRYERLRHPKLLDVIDGQFDDVCD